MKQFSFFALVLLLMLVISCQSAKVITIPSEWTSYKIEQDTVIGSFALPADFKGVNYFFYDSSWMHPGTKDFYYYDRGFKSKDFELSVALNIRLTNGLSLITDWDWGKKAPYKKRKIAGREFWIREILTYSTNFEWPEPVMMYYLDYIDAKNNHFHIDIYCIETDENKKKAQKLITQIAQTISIQIKGEKKTVEIKQQSYR